MGRSAIYSILILLILGLAYSCSTIAIGSMELVSYSFPGYKQTSSFQYPKYSQNDIVFVKAYNLSITTDCQNGSILPRVFLISPSGEKEEFLGLEYMPLKNGSFNLLGIKNNTYKFDKDVVTSGIILKLTGEYSLGYNFDVVAEDRPSGASNSVFLTGVGLLGNYPFSVMDTSNKILISRNSLSYSALFIVFFAFLMGIVTSLIKTYSPNLSKIFKGNNKVVNILSDALIKMSFIYASAFEYGMIILFIFALTLALIVLSMGLLQNETIEVEPFSFISLISTLLVSVLAIFVGFKFVNKEINIKQSTINPINSPSLHIGNIENLGVNDIKTLLSGENIFTGTSENEPSKIDIHDNRALLNKILSYLDEEKPVSTIAEMCLRLAHNLKMNEDEKWLSGEVNGFFKDTSVGGLTSKNTAGAEYKPYRRIDALLRIGFYNKPNTEEFKIRFFVASPLREIEGHVVNLPYIGKTIMTNPPLQIMIDTLKVSPQEKVPYEVENSSLHRLIIGVRGELHRFSERAGTKVSE